MSQLVPRLLRFAAWPLAGLAALAGEGRAEQIVVNLSGHVKSIKPPYGETLLPFTEHGLSVGTPASATIVIESTATGEFHDIGLHGFTTYKQAVVDFSITAGNWTAQLEPPPSYEIYNQVTVTNDASSTDSPDGPKKDAWAGDVFCSDTDGLISAGPTSSFGHLMFSFANVPPDASVDEGLVQDLSRYQSARYSTFTGFGGSIHFDWDTSGNLGGLFGDGYDPTALARQGQHKAAARLGRSVLEGLGHLAGAPPTKHPSGAQNLVLIRAEKRFVKRFGLVAFKAQMQYKPAPADAGDVSLAAETLAEPLMDLADSLNAGADTASVPDRALRRALLMAAAKQVGTDFLAHAAEAKHPAPETLALALAASRAKLSADVAEALVQAGAHGVTYDGPDAEATSDAIDALVQAYEQLTSYGPP